MENRLGKIKSVKFGMGGYQDAMIGISFSLGGDGWGVGDFWGEWATEITESTQWTEKDRIEGLGATTMRILKLLENANKTSIDQLEGVPIEVTFDGNSLKKWRILTEVV